MHSYSGSFVRLRSSLCSGAICHDPMFSLLLIISSISNVTLSAMVPLVTTRARTRDIVTTLRHEVQTHVLHHHLLSCTHRARADLIPSYRILLYFVLFIYYAPINCKPHHPHLGIIYGAMVGDLLKFLCPICGATVGIC